MRHEFKPCSGDCGRCAVCLRSLDCAPHLPLTPRATYPAPSPFPRSGTTIEIQRREGEWFVVSNPLPAAVQGGR